MLKKLIIGIVVLAAVFVVVLAVLWFQINRLVKFGVEKGGTAVLGLETKLDDADVSIIGGSAELNGLTVANPEGFQQEHMFRMAHARSSVNPWSLRSEEILIHEVIVDGADVIMEFKGARTNWQVVMDRLETEKAEEEKLPAERKRMKIERLVFRNGQVQVAGLPAKVAGTVKLPDIEMKNLGVGGEGLTPRELLLRIIPRILQAATKKIEDLPQIDVDRLKKDLQDVIPETGRMPGATEKATEKGKKAIEGAVEGLLGGRKKEEEEKSE